MTLYKKIKVILFSIFTLTACQPNESVKNPAAPFSWYSSNNYIKEPDNLNSTTLINLAKETDDKQLTWLIEKTLENNHDIKRAATRIAQARGLQKSTSAELLPSFDINANAARGRSVMLKPVMGDSYNASFDASYEIDLFGKNYQNVNAAKYNSMAVNEDFAWVKISMISETFRTYIDMRVAEEQILLTDRLLKLLEQTLDLTNRRIQAGSADEIDLERVYLEINQLKAKQINYKRQREILLLSLSTLCGISNQDISDKIISTGKMPNLNLSLILNSPSQIINQRPDIKAARLRFMQAAAIKRAADLDVFPTLNIAAMFGIDKVINLNPSRVWSVGIGGAFNLLNFGRIKGQIEVATAKQQEAYEMWHQTILQGVNDVETALTNTAHTVEKMHALEKADKNAKRSLELAKIRFEAGDSSLLDVIESERKLAEINTSLIDAQGEYNTAIIALYKALGQYERENNE